MWVTALALILITLLLVVAGLIAYGASWWKANTNELRAKLEATRRSISLKNYDAKEIENLPLPVRRYFHAVLNDGQPIISAAKMTHEGHFKMEKTQSKWSSFTSSQIVIMQPPGFDWDASIAMVPGLNVYVHDAYVAGEGILHAELLGLVTLANMRGTPEAAHGELMRFLAEAAWYPTALLPSQGVRWEAIDEMSAKATLSDGITTVSLDFQFDSTGLITCIRAPARHRIVNGVLVATPWRGWFRNYDVRNQMRIPLEGEVAWELPDGVWSYWRGHTREITYVFE